MTLRLLAAFALSTGLAHAQLPSGWSSFDVGSPGQSGGASVSGGDWTVSGGGQDIWNSSDQFHLVSRALRGDGTVLARVDEVGDTNPWAKSGVMIRSDEGANAAYADIVVTPDNGVVFQWREDAGMTARSVSTGGAIEAPVWVRLTRSGNMLRGGYSYDGEHWVELGTPTLVALGATARAGLAVCAGDDSALSTSGFSRVSVVPAGWEDLDVGSPATPGRATFDGQALTVEGSGEVFGSWDAFHFSSQPFVGDLDVVARVDEITGGGTYAKAGVMVRADATPDAPYAFSFMNPGTGAQGQGINFEYRPARGAAAASRANTPDLTAPGWVRLVRRGSVFTAYRSFDGIDWVQNGASVTIPMPDTVRVGVAVSGGGDGLCAARFSGVDVLPAGWEATDVGGPALAGSARFDGLAWRVHGSGADIWGASDQFHFARRHWEGDVTIVARVASLSNTGDFAKAGVMIRDGAEPDAAYALAFVTPDNPQPFAGSIMEVRGAAGASSQPVGGATGALAPGWLMLERSGDQFTASTSGDGVNWSSMGTATVSMEGPVEVGLAVTATNDGALNTAVFTEVSVGREHRTPFLKADGIHYRNHMGSGDVMDLRGTNAGGWMLHEQWLGGMDASGLPDDISIRDTLESRFGRADANRVMAAWEDHWFNEGDLDNIRALGLNVLRVPFSYRCVFDSSWNWRGDAFDRLDWVIDEAWRRGIYVILDLHGAPGGASPFQSSGQVDGGALWFDWYLQDRAVEIWARIAERYVGHPAIAAYDLINEPVPPSYWDMWSLYDRMYDAIRAVDQDHVVMMEGGGGPGVGNSYWTVDTLPSPASQGWVNVSYQSHAYALDGGGVAEGTAQSQISQLWTHGVPLLVGEFNLGDRQSYGVQLWDDNDINWTNWTYKVRQGVGSSWGIYGVIDWPWGTSLQSDPLPDILAALETVETRGRFGLNTTLRDIYGTPLLEDDLYQARPGETLYAAPGSGVLANDTIPNLGQPGITPRAYVVDGPSHGSVSLFEDGSFTYSPAPGFVGADSFRYFVWDSFNDSANIATVSLLVQPLEETWSSEDIGVPAVAGRAELDPVDGSWTIHGGGADISGIFDQFHLAARDMVGDGGMRAHVTSVSNTHPFARAGVMLRDDNGPTAAHAFVHATPLGVYFDVRPTDGDLSTTVGTAPVVAPVWVRLTRSGSEVTGWWSEDGEDWTAIGTHAVALQGGARAGLAVTGHDFSALGRGTFGSVLTSPAVPTEVDAVVDLTEVSLGWSPSPGATAYEVLRSDAPTGPFLPVLTVARPSALDTGLVNGRRYHYVVRALNAAGASAGSDPIVARPLGTGPGKQRY